MWGRNKQQVNIDPEAARAEREWARSRGCPLVIYTIGLPYTSLIEQMTGGDLRNKAITVDRLSDRAVSQADSLIKLLRACSNSCGASITSEIRPRWKTVHLPLRIITGCRAGWCTRRLAARPPTPTTGLPWLMRGVPCQSARISIITIDYGDRPALLVHRTNFVTPGCLLHVQVTKATADTG